VPTDKNVLTLHQHVEALAVVDTWFDEHMPDIEKAEGEVPEALAALLDMANGDFNEKAERVALKVNQLLAEHSMLEDEAARLTRRAKTRKARADHLKRYLHFCLTKANVAKVSGQLVTIRVQKNGQPSVRSALTQEQLAAYYGRQFTEDVPPLVAKVTDFKLVAWRVIEAHQKKGAEALPEGITIEQGTHLRID
jgi:hypothetical protein